MADDIRPFLQDVLLIAPLQRVGMVDDIRDAAGIAAVGNHADVFMEYNDVTRLPGINILYIRV